MSLIYDFNEKNRKCDKNEKVKNCSFNIFDEESYTFSHWDMRSTDIIGDTVINAIYESIEYTVVYYDSMKAEEVVKIETYGYKAEFMPPEAFDIAELKFVGWDKILDGVTTVKENMVVRHCLLPGNI